MREKYILRAGEVGADPEAWILGIYFTPGMGKGKKRGRLTIGGPKRFRDEMDEVLASFFEVAGGTKDDRAEERQKGIERKRLVIDIEPLSLHTYRYGVRRMSQAGINVARVDSTGRLLR